MLEVLKKFPVITRLQLATFNAGMQAGPSMIKYRNNYANFYI